MLRGKYVEREVSGAANRLKHSAGSDAESFPGTAGEKGGVVARGDTVSALAVDDVEFFRLFCRTEATDFRSSVHL